MTTEELREKISAQGLRPILVQLPEDSTTIARFAGNLDAFFEAAKSVEAKIVFLAPMTLDESDFKRKMSSDDVPASEDDDDDSYEGDDLVVDLKEELSPKFGRYIDKEGAFLLITKGGIAELSHFLSEPWWDEFHAAVDRAIDRWKAERNSEHEKSESERDEKAEELRESLEGLLKDRDFCAINTIAGMIKFATDKIPGLDELDDYELKEEIRDLRATIEARGLKKKKES